MLREIVNLFARRKKIIDKYISLLEVQELLSNLNKVTKIKQDYYPCSSYSFSPENYRPSIVHAKPIFKNLLPSEAIEFVKNFSYERQVKLKYQIFTGKKDERHYIDLFNYIIYLTLGVDGKKIKAEEDIEYANLEYVVLK